MLVRRQLDVHAGGRFSKSPPPNAYNFGMMFSEERHPEHDGITRWKPSNGSFDGEPIVDEGTGAPSIATGERVSFKSNIFIRLSIQKSHITKFP